MSIEGLLVVSYLEPFCHFNKIYENAFVSENDLCRRILDKESGE